MVISKWRGMRVLAFTPISSLNCAAAITNNSETFKKVNTR